MQSSTRFPSAGPGVYTRTHTKSFSYAQGPNATANAPPPPPTGAPPMKGDPNMTRSQDEASALAMLTEILREELFLQSEEFRLADRPPERLTKLREAHKEWIVWRVRKELDKLRMWPHNKERAAAEKLEEERKQANEKERARREAEEQRRAAEEQRRLAEEKARERERTLKEERDRAAREQRHKPGGGPSFPWQRRFASGGANPSSNNNGYGTDRESGPRSFDPPPRSHTTAPFPSGASREWNRESTMARSGWDAYQSRWAALNASAAASASASASTESNPSAPPLRGLRFGDIPWPIFSNGPFTPADITSKTVGAFLLSPFHSGDKTTKERLRAALIQWHPDKFEARWLHLVGESEKSLVSQGVGAVARAINDLLAANR